MQDPNVPWRILYLGQLGPGHEYDAMIAISRDARLRCRELGVQGALLFDGQRLCTRVRGSRSALQQWLQAVRADPRQALHKVLMDAPEALQTTHDTVLVPGCWDVGYCEADDLDPFDAAEALVGEPASAAFDRLMARNPPSP